MRREKWISWGCALALALALSYGAVGCMISAFDLDMDMGQLLMGCVIMSAIWSLCYLHRRGDALVDCVAALALGYLWRRGTLVSSFETLAYELSLRYAGGYGWGTLGQRSGTVTAAALILAGDIALTAARAVIRQDSAFPTLTVALVPLLSCMVVTDTVPGEGYLGCLLLGMLLLLLTQSLRRADPGQANTLTAMAALPLAAALALLFWAVPKEGYVSRTEEWSQRLTELASEIPALWESLTGEEEAVAIGDAESQTVDLTEQGPKKQYGYTVMTVTAPTTGTLYLRGQDYDGYTGTGWESSPGRKELFSGDNALDWQYIGNVEITTRRAKDNLYYPYYTGKGQFLLDSGHVDNVDSATRYGLSQYALPRNWENDLPELADQSATGLVRYRKLPEDTRDWAEALLATILSGEGTDTEIARAVGNFVRSHGKYDLNTPKMPEDSGDFAQWFLTESDTGYCVHYATAATVLLRAAGVEARYVTGYMIFAEAGKPIAVTAERAHAWVEYYESRLGTWVVLEATPGMTDSAPGGTEATGVTEVPGESTQTRPDTAPTASDGEEERPQATRPEESTPDPGAPEPEKRPFPWQWLLILLIPAALAGQSELRRRLRRQALRRGNPNRRALALWREITLLAGVLKTQPPKQLEALAQKARFSQHTLTGQELKLFDAWLREGRRQFRERPWYWKLLMRTLYAI